ncbi:MAG: helix-turn-helix transcriptional regulator [Candidatus Competibacteraceae bacterium]|nr:helix-turn-helix transcriptional regulator [Candidatus Competibacteraceae bacterium]
MNELAEYITLSLTRWVPLFKEKVGTSIRCLRQWRYMWAVAAPVSKNLTLIAAALDAGFADSAHFSRAVRNLFSITLSSVFGRAANVQRVLA